MFHKQIAGLKHAHDLVTTPTDMDDEAVALSFFDEENGFRTFFRFDGRAQSTYYRALENLSRFQKDRLRRDAQLERCAAGSPQTPSSYREPAPALTDFAATESTAATSTQSASVGAKPRAVDSSREEGTPPTRKHQRHTAPGRNLTCSPAVRYHEDSCSAVQARSAGSPAASHVNLGGGEAFGRSKPFGPVEVSSR